MCVFFSMQLRKYSVRNSLARCAFSSASDEHTRPHKPIIAKKKVDVKNIFIKKQTQKELKLRQYWTYPFSDS
jgi:hypothetical protein